MKISRRTLLAGVSVLSLITSRGEAFWHGYGVGNFSWKTLNVGAGGYVWSIDIANDGTKVIGTDVGGGYVWNGTKWQQLISPLTISQATYPNASHYNYMGGVWEICVCHGTSSVIWMLIGSGGLSGYLYRSTNGGATFTQTAMPQISGGNFGANGSYKQFRQKMIVDPANPLICAVANASGINVTLDGGNTWNLNATVPAASSAWSGGLVFDPSGGTTGSGSAIQTNNVFLTSYGNGVWFSSTGISGTFTQIANGTSSPSLVRSAQVDYNGVYYCGDNQTNGQFWTYASGTWTAIKTYTGNPANTICVDPRQASAGRAIACVNATGAGFLNETVNAGSSFAYNWTGSGAGSNKCQLSSTGDVTWLAATSFPAGTIDFGDMKIDPTTGYVWCATGFGVMWANVPVSQANFTWQTQAVGIEELASNDVIAPGGKYGFPIVISGDHAGFCLTDITDYPAAIMTGGNNTQSNPLCYGGGADYASNDPTFICVRAYQSGTTQPDRSGWSSDGGQTYNFFAASPSTVNGGCIACATSQHILICVGSGGGLWETTNQGANWTQPSGAPTSGWFGSNTTIPCHVIAADRVTIGTFYAACQTGTAGTSSVWSNAGGTWAQVFSGSIAPDGGFYMRLRSVPSNAGHLFWTVGSVSGAAPPNTFFNISTNGGANWTNISKANGFTNDVEGVYNFGFGAPASGANYPAIYIAGWVDSAWGIWRCTNFNPSSPGVESWTSLGQFANENPDLIYCVNGDMGIYGRCYVGFSGTGFAYYG